MSELEQLTQIIDTILSNNNENRKQGEALLKNIRDRDFNAYIAAFTSLLKGNSTFLFPISYSSQPPPNLLSRSFAWSTSEDSVPISSKALTANGILFNLKLKNS